MQIIIRTRMTGVITLRAIKQEQKFENKWRGGETVGQ